MKRKWHGIPVVLMLILLAVALISGGTSAAVSSYTVMTGNVEVTVLEPLELSNITVSKGSYGSNIWDLQMYAGETAWLMTTLTNLASVDIPAAITSSLSGDCDGEVSATWIYHDGFVWTPLPTSKTFISGGSTDLRLVVNASTSCLVPCVPVVVFTVDR